MALTVVQPTNPTFDGVRMSTAADGLGTNTYNPQQITSWTGGDTGGGGYSAPAVAAAPVYVDPYAQWGGQAAYNSQVNNFNAQKQGILSSADNRITTDAGTYKSGILDLLSQLQASQRNVDQAGLNNEMKYQQGSSDVRGMVGRGIENAGVTLATHNATNSGSAQKFANAYGRIGRQEMSKVGNQYALGERDVAAKQADIESQKALGLRHASENKDSIVNSIVGEAEKSLYALDAAIAGADLPTRIAIEQEKAGIRQRALDQLGQYDATLNQGMTGIHGMDANTRRAQAHNLMLQGQAPASQFDYTTNPDASIDGTGPFASELPIFTFNRTRTRQT